MPGSLFPEGVGWGEVVDSLLMGTGWRVGCLYYTRAENWGVGGTCAGSHTHNRAVLWGLWALGRG